MTTGTEQRKLAAIMFTDMVGYSALAQRSEALALGLLEEHRTLVRTVLPRFNGTEVKTIGDAFLVEFHSALEAAQCGIEIQRTLAKRNADAPAERQIHIRIGIHIGDVVHREGDIYGDGVNIASRIEPLAGAGGICISMDVERQIRSALEVSLVKLARTELKNIQVPMDLFRIVLPWEGRRPMPTAQKVSGPLGKRNLLAGTVLLLVIFGLAVYFVLDSHNQKPVPAPTSTGVTLPGAPVTNRHRIAVLPLDNISPDPNDAYFADGMTEELISTLANLRGLEVIARTSVMPYRNKAKNIAQIGRELSVGTLLEGSVRKAGNQLRITVQLIDVASQVHLLSRDFNRELKDVFAIQAEVAQQVAEAMKVTLGAAEQRQLAQKPPENVDAYSLYLLARYQFNQFTPEGLSNCVVYLTQAIEREPKFALAHAGLLHAYTAIASFGFQRPLVVWPKADEAAQAALKLDSQLVELHSGLGAYALVFSWNWADAKRELGLAISLRPSDRDAHELYGMVLQVLGRLDDGMAEIQRALELGPLSHNTMANLGWAAIGRREYDQAIERGRRTLQLKPGSEMGHYVIALALVQKQHFSQAVTEVKKCDQFDMSPFLLSVLGYAYAAWGKTNEALAVLEKLQQLSQKLPFVPPVQEARIHLALGDEETTFRLLNRAYDERDGQFPTLRFEPPFCDRLRGDPRFVDLMRKAGLPAE
jgi:adenylate cyclase